MSDEGSIVHTTRGYAQPDTTKMSEIGKCKVYLAFAESLDCMTSIWFKFISEEKEGEEGEVRF